LSVFKGYFQLQAFSSGFFCIFFAPLDKILTDKARRTIVNLFVIAGWEVYMMSMAEGEVIETGR